MKNLKYINKFLFENAKYKIADSEGNIAYLVINYKDKNFKVETITKVDPDFIKEAENIAIDLLERKHGVNFAGI
jgi:hypothetical protein